MTIYKYQVLIEDTVRNVSKVISIMGADESEAREKIRNTTHGDMIINKVTIIGRN